MNGAEQPANTQPQSFNPGIFAKKKKNKKYNFSVFTFKTPSLHQLQGQFLIFNIGPDALLTSDPAVN